MSDPSHIQQIVDSAHPAEIPDMLRAVNLFAQAGTMDEREAQAWRDEILLRYLRISDDEAHA